MAYAVARAIYEVKETGLAGETFTRRTSSCRIDGVLSAWNPTITDLADGSYAVAYTPSVAGYHTWIGDGSLGAVITINWDVITAAQADPAASITSGANAEAVAAVIMAEPVGGASGTIGAALARLVSGAVTTIPTVEALSADNTLTLTISASYLAADGDARDFLDTDWTVHALTDVGVAVFFVALAGSLVLRQDMTVVNATTVRLELTAAQTYQMRNASAYKVWAELPSLTDPVLLVGGPLAMQR